MDEPRTETDGNDRRFATRVAAIALLFACTSAVVTADDAPLVDAPVAWYDDEMRDIAAPKVRHPNAIKDYFEMSVSEPFGTALYPPRIVRHAGNGDHVLPAPNVNALGEVPNNSWFTNRIGIFPMTPEEAARGVGPGRGPRSDAPWTVVAAKTQGFSIGFTVRDFDGDRFIVKFDPPAFPGTTTAAGAIVARLFHAAGYNVPDDNVCWLRRADLVLADSVMITTKKGVRPMNEADIDSMLARFQPQTDGHYRAIASRYLDGRPVGPFDYRGKRRDDPNDRVRHEDRRELRGLRVFAAWVSHFDTKQQNTLDMYVNEGGRRFIRHYLIDLASTLGTGVFGPTARETHAYIVTSTFFVRTLTLGLTEPDWRKIQRPDGLNEVGYFSAEYFDPMKYRPNFRNPAFVNMTDRDGYWAAKIITAFTDEHLRAIVAEGHYSNPGAAEHVLRVLAERRDIIGKTFFDRVPPLDFFTTAKGRVRFRDLGMERNIYASSASRYRVRSGACDAQRRVVTWSSWQQADSLSVELSGTRTTSQAPFIAIECQVDRGRGWSRSVVAYVAPASGRVVAVER